MISVAIFFVSLNESYVSSYVASYKNYFWQIEHTLFFYVAVETFLLNTLSYKNSVYFFSMVYIGNTFFLLNNVGLLPYVPTLTSQLVLVFAISFIFMGAFWLTIVEKKKIVFLEHFLPLGLPLVIVPLLVLIEIISAISRMFSLAIRLFSNITAGHALLKILSSFLLILVKDFLIIIFIIGLFLFIAIIAISLLETLIASLQVYVFLSLLLIYINEEQ
jgi:F-type H+-transporting ATPase subunit a